jgi:hypothetical protein
VGESGLSSEFENQSPDRNHESSNKKLRKSKRNSVLTPILIAGMKKRYDALSEINVNQPPRKRKSKTHVNDKDQSGIISLPIQKNITDMSNKKLSQKSGKCDNL